MAGGWSTLRQRSFFRALAHSALAFISLREARGEEGPECSVSDTCSDNFFCNFDNGEAGFCEGCVDHPGACFDLGLPDAGAESCAATCGPKECSSASLCTEGLFCNFDDGEAGLCEVCVARDECFESGLPDAGAEDCAAACREVLCSADVPCAEGYFCDYEGGDSGLCEECDDHPHYCFDAEWSLTAAGAKSCAASCDEVCTDVVTSTAVVNGVEYQSKGVIGSPSISATGPLMNCDKAFDPCPGAEGKACLILRGGSLFGEKVRNCERGGGAAAIIYNDVVGLIDGLIDMETSIPSVFISDTDGEYLLKNELGSVTSVSVTFHGEFCRTGCSRSHPCSRNGTFCNFDFADHGYCEECGGSDAADRCFLSGLQQTGAEECASVCGTRLIFPDCKFCPKEVSGFDFLGKNQTDRCEFCPAEDMQYPEREMRMFGDGVTCWLMEEFFRNYAVGANEENCRLAQMMNYLCGCKGPGYGGANTETKRVVLAWLPRIMSFLSLLGSAFIIIDVTKSKKKRQKTFYQLMLVLSTFDFVGSAAYAFTTLPLPADDYIYGAQGSSSSCKAQGFFIQLGTTSCYVNVSLSVYYLLVIKLSWSDVQVEKRRMWLFLFPVVVGLGLAFAGIPFYDNMILWCNNSSDWWPDIPVAVAIFSATVIMSMVCWHVYREEKASARWRRQGAGGNRLSTKVFWQSFWYLMAFYLTWPPYLALQYMWASGKAYSMYGFILYAGTVVPLQGFWNFIVYMRPRFRKRQAGFAGFFSGRLGSTVDKFFQRMSALRRTERSTAQSQTKKSSDEAGKATANDNQVQLGSSPPSVNEEHTSLNHARVEAKILEKKRCNTFEEEKGEMDVSEIENFTWQYVVKGQTKSVGGEMVGV